MTVPGGWASGPGDRAAVPADQPTQRPFVLAASCRSQPLPGLQAPPALNAAGQSGRIDSGGGQAALTRAVLDEPVGDAKLQQRQLQPLGGKQLRHGRAGAAGDRVLLDCYQSSVAIDE